ncbi:transglutaminase family protein [Methylobacillus flagellatus]|uniref:transglutaminase family protein n=1 Tax=Methylobacillus flagellatus TaxID=405 RepID=UPI00257069B5|nr:transglutaminase family protein [Methylobacillus flagellatus]
MTTLPSSKPTMPPLRYHVQHVTEYDYDHTVTLSQQLLHLTPRDSVYQQCLYHQIRISPAPSESAEHADFFGNQSRCFSIYAPHEALRVSAEFSVQLTARPTMESLPASTPWTVLRDMLQEQASQHLEACAYLYGSPKVPCSPALADYASLAFTPDRPILDASLALTQQIYRDFEYDADATDVSTPLHEVLHNKRGVCQDFAHLMAGCLRSLGLACRYVSGYILTNRDAGQPALIGADASHAWVSVYCPQYGWVDFDPTNNCLVQHEHVTMAWGRDYTDVSPMRGVVLGGGGQRLKVSVTVTAIDAGAPTVQLPL